MERENQKARETHRKEYNDAVRQLAAFIQNRDPRYHAFQRQKARSTAATPTAGRKVPLGKGSRAAPPAPAPTRESIHARMARAKEEARARGDPEFRAQSWQQVEDEFEDDFDDDWGVSAAPTVAPSKANSDQEDGDVARDNVGASDADEDSDEESEEAPDGWDCIACHKSFASQGQWENHEKSKKHKQAIWK